MLTLTHSTSYSLFHISRPAVLCCVKEEPSRFSEQEISAPLHSPAGWMPCVRVRGNVPTIATSPPKKWQAHSAGAGGGCDDKRHGQGAVQQESEVDHEAEEQHVHEEEA